MGGCVWATGRSEPSEKGLVVGYLWMTSRDETSVTRAMCATRRYKPSVITAVWVDACGRPGGQNH